MELLIYIAFLYGVGILGLFGVYVYMITSYTEAFIKGYGKDMSVGWAVLALIYRAFLWPVYGLRLYRQYKNS